MTGKGLADERSGLLLVSDGRPQIVIPTFPGMISLDLTVDGASAIECFVRDRISEATDFGFSPSVSTDMAHAATDAILALLRGYTSEVGGDAAILGCDVDDNGRPVVFVAVPILFESRDVFKEEWQAVHEATRASEPGAEVPVFQHWAEADRTIGRWVWLPESAHVDQATGLQSDVFCRAMFMVDVHPDDVQLALFATAVGTAAGSLVNAWSTMAEQAVCAKSGLIEVANEP